MILDYKKSCFNYNKVVKKFKKVEDNVETGNSKKLCHLSKFFQKVSVHFQNLSILKTPDIFQSTKIGKDIFILSIMCLKGRI